MWRVSLRPTGLLVHSFKPVQSSVYRPSVHKYILRNLSNNIKPTGNEETKPKLSTTAMVVGAFKGAWDATVDMAMNPRKTWISIKEVAHHYWIGTKLLAYEINITVQILRRVLQGHSMTRRERMQLIRTTNDMFRLVPFMVFVIVPFMEFLLPFALKLFPNMLPSTFQDGFQKEENMKKELQMRLALAGFLQDALKEMVDKKGNDSINEKSSAKEIIDFIERARLGEKLPNDSVIRIAKLFRDELTLNNIARPQLVSLCEYMGLRPYGNEPFLRYQIRNKLRKLREDDRRILWEGVDSLTIDELRDACQERGMRSVGLTHFGYKRQLQDWLDLSIQKNIPISLLIMSRAFSITSKQFKPDEVLTSSISALADDTINEVVVANAKENTAEMKMRKLESLQFQTELIDEETTANVSKVAKAASDKAKAQSEFKSSDKLSSTESVNDEIVEDKLSVHEVEALGDLARGSVVREKAELSKLEAGIDTAIDKEKSQKNLDGQTSNVDKEAQNLHSVLNSMVNKLRKQIDTTEKALGDKLNFLDKDGDGELSSDEIKEALSKILKSAKSDEEAEKIFKMLDKDSDGTITVVELLQYVESRKRELEVEDHLPSEHARK